MQIFELNYAKRPNTLVESVCRDLTRDQRRIVEGIVRELRPLFETTLDPNQIQQIFKLAQEKQAERGGGARTAVGRAVDTTKAAASAVGSAASSVNSTIDRLGQYLQTTAPVQYFDQKFEDLKQKVAAKLGPNSQAMATIDQLGQYAKANPGKTAFVIGTLTAVAALTTGPAGGAVAGQVLRGATELLKGEKLSTAVGKGAKSAAIGGLAGAAAKQLGDLFSGSLQAVADQLHPGVNQLKLNWTINGAPVANIDVHGLPQDITPIQTAWRQAGAAYRNGDINTASRYLTQIDKLVDKISTPEYISKLSTEVADRQKWQAGADAFKKAVDTAVAAAQGAVTATTNTGAAKPAAPAAAQPAAQPKPAATAQPAAKPAAPAQPAATKTAPPRFNELREGYRRLTNSEIREIFAIAGGQLTEGPTWDKIKSAGSKIAQVGKAAAAKAAPVAQAAAQRITNKQVSANTLLKHWERSGQPDDSGIIADILRHGNVTDDVIKDIYDAMGIEMDTPASTVGRSNAIPLKKTSTSTTAAPTTTATPATAPAAAAAATPAATKYTSPLQVVDAIMNTMPKDWLPEITSELLKRQRVSATKK